ncbi:LINE-1 reverse transcriptase isogeny [Gossypium australe]|uniref:LINE-1 reverse transcriptase isogeny n=1 Tax=Gossypium australe TaxID=47621 RepID=A0A5B6W452_9ROSI|nr:LINE-1 reverse transcriptase isogeny [Gossypium australe]
MAVGVPEFLRKVIMSAISSSSMQILWNGVPTQKFKPARGIRQGCPLSPYLFVLCMDWLGHLIKSNIDIGRWEPVKLSRSGPAISHLFFADDLVIFYKAHIDQARLLKSILDQFCDVLGHKISTRKSNIYFSKGIVDSDREQIVNLFGFQEVQNLGFYLGVLLLHNRVTKSTFSFVVDKVRSKLNSWDARKLSIAGRVTLAKSVLLSIPNYFMQSMLIPKGVCAEIEKMVRHFIWGGSEGQSKLSLVAWDSICQPRSREGLGIRQLNDQNTSFLMKIGFGLVSKSSALWVRVLRAKYGWKEQILDSINKSQCSHLWRSLSKI